MRKLIYLVAALAMVAAAALAINDAPAHAEASLDQADKVGICHFPGHDGDFVLGNQTMDPPYGACHNFDGPQAPVAGPNSSGDGIVMFVSHKACEKGHGAVNLHGPSCSSH